MLLDPAVACALIYKLRRLHGAELAEPDGADGSNDVDDGMDDVLVEGRDNGNAAEIRGILEGLESEQYGDLVALVLLGRDPQEYSSFQEARRDAREFSTPLMDYFVNNAGAAEFLAGGLESAGYDCEPLGGDRLQPASGGIRRNRLS